jgi:hypothetical protein
MECALQKDDRDDDAALPNASTSDQDMLHILEEARTA